MADYEDVLLAIRALKPSCLGYVEILQEEVSKNPDRPVERPKAEGEDPEETSLPPQRGQPNLVTVPYSIPRALAVSPSLGGLAITPELAVDKRVAPSNELNDVLLKQRIEYNLRRILFGNTFHVFNYEWKKSFFKFREPYTDMSYALEAERGGARAIQMVVQAHIIKYLLFTRQTDSDNCTLQSINEVSEKEQDRALAAAMTDILWAAGETRSATVVLVTSEYCITPHLDYKLDNFTERLQLFIFNKKEEVRKFIYEHILCYKDEGSHGVILFLYSLIFSRTITRLREDLDITTSHLLHLSLGNFVCRQALLNLLLTGRASPHVFNGTLVHGEDGGPLEQPLHGVLGRSDVGYLHWSREEVERGRLPAVGSMLKTPKWPVWVSNINGTYGVFFSPNRSLLSDWKMEHLFSLNFYNGQPSQLRTALLTIHTHSHHWEAGNTDALGDPERRFPSVEMTIRTKWEGAVIDWNGTVPFF